MELELWEYLKQKDIVTYKTFRRRVEGLAGSNSKLVCNFCKVVYVIVRKIFKFNWFFGKNTVIKQKNSLQT